MYKRSFHCFGIALFFIALTLVGPVQAQKFLDLPEAVYYGCEDSRKAPKVSDSPRERTENFHQPNSSGERLAKRTFASFSLADVESALGGESADCWYRLEGVWRETGKVVLDRSQDPKDWGSDDPNLIALANGTYTTPGYLMVVEPKNPDEVLYLREGLNGYKFVKFVSRDGVSLKEVLKRGGRTKTYQATQPFEFGQTLRIDVMSRTGSVRLMVGNRDFIRPKPGVTKATADSQLAMDDAFLVSYNLVNLSASRSGYDVTSQDPFYLLDNDKGDVFAETPAYAIRERSTVPLGFSILQQPVQGTVYRKSLVSSSKDFQETFRHAYGAKIGYEQKATDPVTGSEQEASASVGTEASESHSKNIGSTKTVAQAVAYSRAKKYTLVVDHPFVTLSDSFINAVEDARKNFRYQKLIDKFGTHYPYAVTYGAAARLTQNFTEESYRFAMQSDESTRTQAGVKVFGPNASGNVSNYQGTNTGMSGSIGDEGMTFVAVGGNGSWDQNGFVPGDTPAPILLDLRPIHELLNPMNFPNEPEIYETVRKNLESTVARYMLGKANRLSSDSVLDTINTDPAPEAPKEKWYVYVKTIMCSGANDFLVKKMTGELSANYVDSEGKFHYDDTINLSTPCKQKKIWTKISYRGQGKKVVVLEGTREEIAEQIINFNLKWRFHTHKKKTERAKAKTFNADPAAGNVLRTNLGVGKYKDYTWEFGPKALPKVHIKVRFKRVK